MGKKEFVGLDEEGFEHPDPRPVEMPTRLRLPQRQVDRVREVIRRELSMRAQEDGYESFDEADDFDLPGEDPVSAYEEVFEPSVVESPVQRGAAKKGEKDDGASGKDGVDGRGQASGSVGAGRVDKGTGKASGAADGAAGGSGGVGSADPGVEGSAR